MTRFLLIRHATTDSVGRRLSGRTTGVHLNDAGHLQAAKLARRLADVPLAAIYSSPLERALETASLLCKQRDLAASINDDFMEIDFGEWTNLSFEDLDSIPAFQYFNKFRSSTRIPGGESMLEAQVRVISGLQKLCIRHPGQTVAVVSHSDIIKATVSYYAGIHLDMFQRIEISPASVSVIEIYDETARILVVNDTGELRF